MMAVLMGDRVLQLDRSPACLRHSAVGVPVKADRRVQIVERPAASDILLRIANTGPERMFYARLSGLVRRCNFKPGSDRLTMTGASKEPVIAALVESEFSPRQWSIGSTATHARTATIRRGG